MPRGGGRAPKKNYKGRSRHFTDEESLREQLEKERREKQWRKQREGDEEDEEKEGAARGGEKDSSDEESSSDEEGKHKGVEHLIEIENPNRVMKKNKKLTEVDSATTGGSGGGSNLSRREREELQKQQAKERYDKLHMEGKTDEARADLARLALIRKQREDAAKKREEERKAKEEKEKEGR